VVFLCTSVIGFAEWSGEVGFWADGRPGNPITLTGSLGLTYSYEILSFTGNVEFPFTSPASWRASLRGAIPFDPIRFNVQLVLDGTGTDCINGALGFMPDPWDLWGGDLRLKAILNFSVRDPLGEAALSSSGNLSLKYQVEGLWWEVGGSFELYPLPPSVGRKILAFGYSPDSWWITARSSFAAAWDRTTLEFGNAEGPLSFTARGELTPVGFARATVTVSLTHEGLRASGRFGLTPAGPTYPNFSVSYRDGNWSFSLSVGLGASFQLEKSRMDLSYRF